MRVLLTGGGTGGHIYPALAIAEALQADARFAPLELLFVGNRDGLEAQIVAKAGLPLAFVRSAPLLRKLSPALLRTVVDNALGFVQSLALLHRFRPDVAVATGGYVTLPVIAALRLVRLLGRSRARIALLEPNAEPGLTNRLLAPLVDETWLSLVAPGRALGPRTAATGTPVRASFRRPLERAAARLALGLAPELTTIVVMGGSQGARTLNEAVAGLAASGLPAGWQLLHVSGTRDFERAASAERLTVRAYLDDPATAYAAADVVVARAGASTLGELVARETPALLVPYPYATADHQARNAAVAQAAGGAIVVPDRELDAPRLRAELQALLEPGRLAQMRASLARRAGEEPTSAIRERLLRLLPHGEYAPVPPANAVRP